MGTVIYGSEDEKQCIKRFWGGKDGVCFKINLDIILTKQEYLDLLDKMYKGLL